jgi:hypothetical protein
MTLYKRVSKKQHGTLQNINSFSTITTKQLTDLTMRLEEKIVTNSIKSVRFTMTVFQCNHTSEQWLTM